MKIIKNRIIDKLRREALVHSINTSVITVLVEKFIADRYPDIGEYKFLERDIPTHLNGPQIYSDAGILGYFLDKDKNEYETKNEDNNDKIKLCQIELNQYYLSLNGKNFISEHNIPSLKGFYFTIIIGIELDDSFNPVYSEELFQLLRIGNVDDIIEELKAEANESWMKSTYLNNYICVSTITEPQLLYQTIMNNL